MVFGSIHVRPTRERNLESVSSGPVGKTSLHISYVGVHSCASILTSSLSTRFLHSLPQRFSMLVTWYKLVSSCSKLVKLDEDLAAAIFRDLVKWLIDWFQSRELSTLLKGLDINSIEDLSLFEIDKRLDVTETENYWKNHWKLFKLKNTIIREK